jgi:CelD/BcsL family acetyltransferase involved in cellulose biosynthesis
MHAPLSNAYRAEWCGLADLTPLADEIRALAARAAEPNVFYEPAFMLAAAPVFGPGAGAVLVRSATGRLTGLFPARIERPQGGLVPMLCGFTHPFAPLGVPLIDRDDAEAVVGAWLDRLAGDRAMPALLLMPFIPEQGAFARTLDAVLSRTRRANAAFGQHQRALLDPGTERDGYLERAVSAGRRKEMRRLRRRMEEFGPVTFDTTTDPDGIAAALQDFLVLEASGWAPREAPSSMRLRSRPSCRPPSRRLRRKAMRGSTACRSTGSPSPPPSRCEAAIPLGAGRSATTKAWRASPPACS